MKLAVIGGSGYIGQSLIARLVDETNASIVSISQHAENTQYDSPKVTAKNCNIFDTEALAAILKECDAVYYLVHMMNQKEIEFTEAEAKAARSLVVALKGSSVAKIIFLGGLGDDSKPLSDHLASRHKTGEILRESDAQVIEFRASMVVGKGSVSYDIVVNLVEKLPIMALPTWAKTHTQPIGLRDALSYLVAALNTTSKVDEIIEIGGPEAMTYEQFMRRYASWKHTKTHYIHVPFVPVFVASHWLDSFTPGKHARIGRIMVESLANAMVVTNNHAEELFPEVSPTTIERHFV